MAAQNNKQNETNDATMATGTTGVPSHDTAMSGGGGSSSSTGGSTTGGSSNAMGSTGAGSSTTGGGAGTIGGSGTTGGGQSSGQGGTGSSASGGGSGIDAADQAATTVGNVLRGDATAAAGTARGIVSQVKESGGKVASEALGTVKEKATTKIEEQKATLAQGLGSVADTIRQVGSNLQNETGGENNVVSTVAKYGDTLAGQVEQFSNYLEKHNVSDMLREVERFARRNPAYFIGGAFLLGMLGARFLKSSNPNQALMPYEGSGGGTDQEVFHRRTDVGGSGEGVRPV